MAQRTADQKPLPAPYSPAQLREKLLRPFPTLSWRSLLIVGICILVLLWSVSGSETNVTTLVEGIPDVARFIGQLFPPEYELQRGTERTFLTGGGAEFTVPIIEAETTIREKYVIPQTIYIYENGDPVLVPVEELSATMDRLNEQRVSMVRYVIVAPDETLETGETRELEFRTAERTIRADYSERQTIYLYVNDQPVPVEQRDLAQQLSLLRNEGVENVRYVVGGSGITIGFPTIITSIAETIQMAIIGTLGAVLLAMPFGLLAARNISPHPTIYTITRLFLNFLRSIPELIYALIFVAAVGLGPFPGVLALIFGSVGSISRLFAEAIEQIDPQQVLAVRATGASGIQTFMFGVFPQALPLLISYSLVYFEHNVRNATILGIVGAGGIGQKLYEYVQLFYYNELLGAVILLVLAVTVIDRFSNYVRSRFI